MTDWQTVLRQAGAVAPQIASELEAVIALFADVASGIVDETQIRAVVGVTPAPADDADPDEEVPDLPHPVIAALEQAAASASGAAPPALWATLRVLPDVLARLRSVLFGAPLPADGPRSMRGMLAELERDVPGDGTSPWRCPRCGSHNVTARAATRSARRRWEVHCVRCGLSAAFYEDNDPARW